MKADSMEWDCWVGDGKGRVEGSKEAGCLLCLFGWL